MSPENPPPVQGWIRGMVTGGVILLLLTGVMVVVVNQMTARLSNTLQDLNPEDYRQIALVMGIPLPASAREPRYQQGARVTAISFSLPPQDYRLFMQNARPVIEAGCWTLPLVMEGVQPKKPGCGNKTLSINVDKSNASLWRILIDIRG